MEEEVLPKLLKYRDKEFLMKLGKDNIECLRKYEQNNLRYSRFTRDARLRTLMHTAIEIGKPFNLMEKEISNIISIDCQQIQKSKLNHIPKKLNESSL